MAEKGTKFIGATLAVAMVGGCAPDVSPKVAPTESVRRGVLDCPSLPGLDGNRQVVLRDLKPGEKIVISNRSTELLPHNIEVQQDGRLAMSGQSIPPRKPGELFAASGYPDNDATIYHVVAGEPEFSLTSNEVRWINLGTAVTAFCVPLQSPYGYFAPAGPIVRAQHQLPG